MPQPAKQLPLLPSAKPGDFDLLIIAGEHSGDQQAARMLRRAVKLRPNLKVAAIGGEALKRAGATLLHDLTATSVVGLVEVLKNYGYFRSLMDALVRWIGECRPKAVCFVDYPGFNLRLAERLKNEGISQKGGGDVQLLYYISPQIWAWKAHRRFKMAELLDALAVIFPFEIECYSDTSLPVSFTGHPFVDPEYKNNLRYDPDGPILLLPGSRTQAVSRIFPVMVGAMELFLRTRPGAKSVVMYPDEGVKGILTGVVQSGSSALRESIEFMKADESVSARAALLSSGTMSLTCALAGIPGVICYRAHPLTYFIGRRVVKVPFLGIANLLLPESPPYPEFIQGAARPETLARELEELTSSMKRQKQARVTANALADKLTAESQGDAASWLLGFLE